MEPVAMASAQIPSSFYVIVGTLVIANLGTVVTIFYGIGRVVWFLAKMDSRLSTLEVELPKDINAAFEKIRELKQDLTK
jgi:amino acid transporter